jgi:uncharacterized membrane-anchored protein
MSRKFTLVAVTLPLLAIVLGIARAELSFARSRDFTFEVTGYDPRDLLRGHYLQFRLALDPLPANDGCELEPEGCCLCVRQAPGEPVASVANSRCTAAQSGCEAWLAPSFASQPLRYYVPEARALELERQLQTAVTQHKAHARMAVRRDGRANIRELRIDGRAVVGGVGGGSKR